MQSHILGPVYESLYLFAIELHAERENIRQFRRKDAAFFDGENDSIVEANGASVYVVDDGDVLVFHAFIYTRLAYFVKRLFDLFFGGQNHRHLTTG